METAEASVIGKMEPIQLFEEYTGVSPEIESAITVRCLEQGFIPLIGDHPDFGRVFHTLCCPQHDRVYRKGIASHFDPHSLVAREKAVEVAVCDALRGSGINCDRQVACAAGVIDILTSHSVIELKVAPSRQDWQRAIGQVLSYHACSEYHHCGPIIVADYPAPEWIHEACRRNNIAVFRVADCGDLIKYIEERMT